MDDPTASLDIHISYTKLAPKIDKLAMILSHAVCTYGYGVKVSSGHLLYDL